MMLIFLAVVVYRLADFQAAYPSKVLLSATEIQTNKKVNTYKLRFYELACDAIFT